MLDRRCEVFFFSTGVVGLSVVSCIADYSLKVQLCMQQASKYLLIRCQDRVELLYELIQRVFDRQLSCIDSIPDGLCGVRDLWCGWLEQDLVGGKGVERVKHNFRVGGSILRFE